MPGLPGRVKELKGVGGVNEFCNSFTNISFKREVTVDLAKSRICWKKARSAQCDAV